MKADILLERLEAVAAALEIRVSYEQLSTAIGHNRGGLCRVKGEFRVIIDKRATTGERVATLATSLGRFAPQIAELDLEISPAVREVLHTHSLPDATRRAS